MAGNLSIETCGSVFQSRQASSNYGIGTDGRVGMYVEEKDRSWASSSPANDHRAVTIEVANSSTGGNWPVSDKAMESLINLCVDICQRNGIPKLNFTGDKSGNLTQHNYFAATACPGPYLKSKFQYIADEVNKRLGGNVKPAEPKEEECKVNLKTLKKGSEGDCVKSLQILLIGYGYSCGSYGADGDFGSATDSAVRKFQKAKGLVVDGIVGPATWSKLLGV
jgi:N-acetyl-anhydromuramyl-L-alanine amidase AmpD